MSTQINVTVGDQRLLQASKTRAAANQQNLDDRLTENKTAAALEPELEKKRQEEEQPGSIPVRRIPRRPAAQRQPETLYNFYLFSTNTNLETQVNTDTVSATVYDVVGRRAIVNPPFLPFYVRITVTKNVSAVNTITTKTYTRNLQLLQYTPEYKQNFIATTPVITIPNTYTTGAWVVEYTDTLLPSARGNFEGTPGTFRATYPLPPNIVNLYSSLSYSYTNSLISVTKEFTYVSTYYTYILIELPIYKSIEWLPFESQRNRSLSALGYVDPLLSQVIQATSKSIGNIIKYVNFTTYGQYIKLNNITGEMQIQVNQIFQNQFGQFFSPPSQATLENALLQGLYQTDPRYLIFKDASSKGGDYYARQWEPNHMYDPTTGKRIFSIRPSNSPNTFIVEQQLDSRLPYSQVPRVPTETEYIKGLESNTMKILVTLTGEQVGGQTVLPFYTQTF